MTELRGLQIYTQGDLTIVTFKGKGSLAEQSFIGAATEHLDQIVQDHNSKVLVIELGGITALPSAMLGVLVGVKNRGVEVRLFNAGQDVRFTLELMKLDEMFDLREGDLSSLIETATEE